MNTENLSTLKIHKLTKAQYERELAAGRIDENALYLTPDEGVDLSEYATVEQLNENIETAKSYTDDEIAEWVGDTTVAEQISTAIASKSDTTHTHDDKYYTESEIDTKLSSKSDTTHNHDSAYAGKSHGNHVPAVETANNAKFLRNDNTWQTVTPENIGAAASSHGTHVSYSTANPVMDGTASVGFASTVARSDHKHPTDTSRAAASDLTALQSLVGDTKVSTQISTAINGITHPVTNVNNKTGAVTLTASDVSARANTWMPTAADVGAAPSGYGLGESAGRPCSDCNTALLSGIYYMLGLPSVNNCPTNGYFHYGVLFVERRSTEDIYQTISFKTYKCVRYSMDSGTTWSEWEWVNPPMDLGVEYRTTERYAGKAVYTQLVDCGNLPNASQKNVTFPNVTTYEKIISVSCYAYSPDLGGFNLPYIDSTGSMRVGYILVGSYIRLFTTFDASSVVCKALIKYTKD